MNQQRGNLPVVAIVGRPNVGKSTLFNRLIRSKKAIVDATPGVTRDRNYGDVFWQGNRFRLIDTGGIGYPADSSMRLASMLDFIRKQAEAAISEADLILFLCDGKQGLLWEDREVARLLWKTQKNTLLVINKIDELAGNEVCPIELLFSDFYKLGVGEPTPISAAHGLNVDILLDKILPLILPYQSEPKEEGIQEISPISVAIVGKPNVGKSSILNAILGQERVIVDNVPGTTRDAIDTLFEKGNTQFVFIDTAGIRKKSKVTESLEYYSVLKAIKSIERASVVLLIIDAVEKVSVQDKKIVAYMEKTGCAGIIIVNKWDLVLAKRQASVKPALLMDQYKAYIQDKIPYLSHFPIMFTSAITKEGIGRLLSLIEKVSKEHKKWVSTSALNAAIKLVYSQRKPPSSKGKNLKIYYATQVKTSPPTFLLFVNHPSAISTSYMKYLQNRIRSELRLSATPIQIKLRKRPR